MFRLFALLLVGLVSQSNFFVAVASERTTITCTVKGSGVNQWTSASVKKSIQLEIEKYFVKSLSHGRAIFYLDGPYAITSLFGPHALQISPQCNNCLSPEHPSHKVTAELFKNGSMNLTKNYKRWFKYLCDKNSIDVLAVLDGLAKNGTSSTTNTQSGVNYTSSTQVASSSTTQSNTPTDNIMGSIWRIYEDDGEITVFHFNQDGTVAYLVLSSTNNQGKTYDDGHDLWSATDDFIEISFSDGYSNMTLKFDNDENRVKGTLVLNSGEIKRVGGHLENENVKFVGGKFFNVQKPSQKTIDKQIALLKNTPKAQIASTNTTQSDTPTSAELLAAQRKAEELEQQLATLKAQQEQQQQTISNDTQIPLINIASNDTKGKQGVIRGRASDNVGVAEVTIDGNAVAVQRNGSFEYSTFVPPTGLTVTVQATDMAGLSSKQTVSLQRNGNLTSAAISFDRLNPIGKPALKNKNAIALIIGIGSYENIIDAAYADKDALMFRDYAAEKLGIPESRIKTLINEDAEIGEVLLGIRKWIRRSAKPDKTDVYIFYAGHGIATANGEAYILPYDGRPEVDLLDRTALLQKELFAEIDKAKPRNVTIFLDACYTGKARTGEVLMADANYRPLAIRPIDDGMPDNFTLITASSGDEFSGPLEEAKHGLFSYFLMKGMEGDADSNQDNRITAGELHQFVKKNVLRQSADKQTPELQGNASKILVTFK